MKIHDILSINNSNCIAYINFTLVDSRTLVRHALKINEGSPSLHLIAGSDAILFPTDFAFNRQHSSFCFCLLPLQQQCLNIHPVTQTLLSSLPQVTSFGVDIHYL